MRVLITGGCKNGKSHYAQKLAKAQQQGLLYYVATMKPQDEEDAERIGRHRREREGWGFITVEQPADIEEILRNCDNGASFLLDSLTALLANEMFGKDSGVKEEAGEKVAGGLRQILKHINNIVIVSDYIYSDALLYDKLTEAYRRSLAKIDRLVAANCDIVLEIAYANVIVHKGEEVLVSL